MHVVIVMPSFSTQNDCNIHEQRKDIFLNLWPKWTTVKFELALKHLEKVQVVGSHELAGNECKHIAIFFWACGCFFPYIDFSEVLG